MAVWRAVNPGPLRAVRPRYFQGRDGCGPARRRPLFYRCRCVLDRAERSHRGAPWRSNRIKFCIETCVLGEDERRRLLADFLFRPVTRPRRSQANAPSQSCEEWRGGGELGGAGCHRPVTRFPIERPLFTGTQPAISAQVHDGLSPCPGTNLRAEKLNGTSGLPLYSS